MLSQHARNSMLSPNHLWLHRTTHGYTDRVIANLPTPVEVWRSRPPLLYGESTSYKMLRGNPSAVLRNLSPIPAPCL